MAESEVYRIEIPIIVDDQTEAPLRQARERVNRFQKDAERTNQRLRQMAAREYKLRLSAVDRASIIISRVGAYAKQVTSRTYRMTIGIWDLATRPIRAIGALVTSTLGLLGIGGGIFGGVFWPLKLSGSMEQAGVALQVLLGSAEAAQKRLAELSTFAATTPFQFPQVIEASRVLQVFGGSVLATGENLRMVGDIAAGTTRPFEEVALWIGRMYDAIKSGRPFGEATARLQEMGAISGEARARIEKLAASGMAIDRIWPLVTKEFQQFDGMMKKQSRTLFGLLSTLKDTFEISLLSRWGDGLRSVLGPRLQQLIDWFGKNEDAVKRWGDTLERTARDAARWIEDKFSRTFRYIRVQYLDNPEFQRLDFAGKVNFVIDDLSNTLETWWNSPGGEKVRDLGSKLGSSLINSMGTAAMKAVLEHPLLALLLGAYVGLQAPGPIQLKAVVAISIAAAPWVMRILNWISEHSPLNPEPKIRQQNQAWQWYEEQRTTLPTNEPLLKGQTIGPVRHALGGVFNQPHIGLVAEAGPEVVIPLASRFRNRALDLWQTTGRYISAPVPVAASGNNTIINLTLNLGGLVGQVSVNSRENLDGIADQIAGIVGEKLKETFHNLPK